MSFTSTPTFGFLTHLIAKICFAVGLTCSANTALAAFEIAVSPTRFELAERGGKRVGQSLTIYNLGNAPTEVTVRTIDWTYSAEGEINYFDDLQPNSCRPWVTLERASIKIRRNDKANFRFQVDIPADAPRGECRLMLAIEGKDPAYEAKVGNASTQLSLPINGRIAVAVYMAVNGAEPKIEFIELGIKNATTKQNGGVQSRTPFIKVTNRGDATGRLEGVLAAKDATGQELEFSPEGTPVLPGQTRVLALTAQKAGTTQAASAVTFPIQADGLLDWDKGSFKIRAELK